LAEPRVTAALIGPGNGVTAETADNVLRALAAQPCVLDADALTVFAAQPETLFSALSNAPDGASVLTPHEGEFARLFPAGSESAGKIERTTAAAAQANATVLLKGADTVIAAPDGRAAVNGNAPPYLATAGSGDVLAGFIVGLMAQGLPAFEAACAGAWLHGACAAAFGPGLIADDIADMLPNVLSEVMKNASYQ
jgi:NAD(P)H-hydrate epimerase